ncbi:dienelactone hydrolase family protein [Methanosarcina sp. T3]|uniref:dienelactone hydrolase family protein n=1 Tax=Methanosarcina sp. T3 TaxID=3439062 RepID=UPI003F85278D
MQGAKLQGVKLEGTEILKIVKNKLATVILDVKSEKMDSFEFIRIETSRGRVDCKYYKAEGTDKGVIMVGGVGGDFETPAGDLYPRLCIDLRGTGISSLRVKFRNPINLAESLLDVLVGIEFLKVENIRIFGLIGYSFGGAVIVQAAFNEKKVKTIVMLSTQSFGVSPISFLSEDTSVLILHGKKDEIIPPEISEYVYNLAHEPKKIKIYDLKAGHSLNEVSEEVYVEVKNWIINNLKKEPEKRETPV